VGEGIQSHSFLCDRPGMTVQEETVVIIGADEEDTVVTEETEVITVVAGVEGTVVDSVIVGEIEGVSAVVGAVSMEVSEVDGMTESGIGVEDLLETVKVHQVDRRVTSLLARPRVLPVVMEDIKVERTISPLAAQLALSLRNPSTQNSMVTTKAVGGNTTTEVVIGIPIVTVKVIMTDESAMDTAAAVDENMRTEAGVRATTTTVIAIGIRIVLIAVPSGGGIDLNLTLQTRRGIVLFR
jgi:hypothetical protein